MANKYIPKKVVHTIPIPGRAANIPNYNFSKRPKEKLMTPGYGIEEMLSDQLEKEIKPEVIPVQYYTAYYTTTQTYSINITSPKLMLVDGNIDFYITNNFNQPKTCEAIQTLNSIRLQIFNNNRQRIFMDQ